MWSSDLRWRCLVLHNLYSVRIESVSVIMGVSTRSVKRWIALFEQTGNVVKDLPRARSARWPEQVYQHIQSFIQENPCFYVEELQVEIMKQFPDLRNVSIPTICRALRHDLRLSRKFLEKRAREREILADLRDEVNSSYFQAS